MAELEPASDELIAATEAEAKEVDAFWGDLAGVEIAAGPLRAILARLRKAEADNANLTKLLSGYVQICSEAGIGPSSSDVYAAGQRLTERSEKAKADLARLHAAIDEAEKHGPEVVHFIRAMAKGGGNG